MTLAELERDKYLRMWARPEYHVSSPGERSAHQFRTLLPVKLGDTVVDVGCGSGKASVLFEQWGYQPTCLDFCRSAVEPPAQHLPYIDAVLWELPALSFDWFYCVDVLEHIPPEQVDAVLDGMARISTKGGYLQICCVGDGCGDLIGETLHLTVQPVDWWKEKVQARWPIVQDVSFRVYAAFALGPSLEVAHGK